MEADKMKLNYQKPERKYLCDFSLETCIYDVDLPTQIKDKLASLNVLPTPDMVYVLDVSFDVKVYHIKEFYKFPVERKQWQIDELEKQSPKRQTETMIHQVLAQQLNNICKELSPLNIQYETAIIAGEEFDNLNRVDFCIYESEFIQKESPKDGKKKTRRKETTLISHSIIPHRPYIAQKAAEFFAEQMVKRIEEEYKRSLDRAAHIPNLIKADKVFTALATAIMDEFPDTNSSAVTLAYELSIQAKIKNDWPFEIIGQTGYYPKENTIGLNDEIDCPDYLIYVKRKHDWALKKVNGLDSAKNEILYHGYNTKSVEQIIVLHNLEHIKFNLLVEDCGEIIPIAKSEAHTAKKLFLSWCNK